MRELHRVTISGSFQKHIDHIASAMEEFKDNGIEVLSPKSTVIVSSLDGFVSLRGDPIEKIYHEKNLPEAMRLIENSHLQAILHSDALWLTLPRGYCGTATAFEVGYALANRVPIFYQDSVTEPIIRSYAHKVSSISELVHSFDNYPPVSVGTANVFTKIIHHQTSYSSVAVGPVVMHDNEVLLVKTHKWNNRYSIIGGSIQKNESLDHAFGRVVAQQTGLNGIIENDVCAFDELPSSGFYQERPPRIFVDKIFRVESKSVKLDHQAEEFIWISPVDALTSLDIEPNARKTLLHYQECSIFI